MSREINALSYNTCSFFDSELNPETNIAAFSLKTANRIPIIANRIAKTAHDQNPIFKIKTFSYKYRFALIS